MTISITDTIAAYDKSVYFTNRKANNTTEYSFVKQSPICTDCGQYEEHEQRGFLVVESQRYGAIGKALLGKISPNYSLILQLRKVLIQHEGIRPILESDLFYSGPINGEGKICHVTSNDLYPYHGNYPPTFHSQIVPTSDAYMFTKGYYDYSPPFDFNLTTRPTKRGEALFSQQIDTHGSNAVYVALADKLTVQNDIVSENVYRNVRLAVEKWVRETLA